MSALSSSFSLLIQAVGGLYIIAVMLRFLLQLVQADFYNPITQAIVKITSPLLNPVRKVIPSVAGVDTASIVLALALQIALIYLLLAIKGFTPDIIPFPQVMISSLVQLANRLLDIYMYSLVIIAIASWIVRGNYNPGLMLLMQLTEPLSSRVRKIIPPLGGLDFSMMIIILIIYFLRNLLSSIA
ncbi:MAG: YggT family protein [Candidatus Endonucleobacter bathymodioli]|uniref:YggT family protein n=1 Tax=Candidatus Endonucleibacter bathymodioli TaxID=539814 RepID=A0AA90NZA6_9GAMM|nr:YggT family protein [Candidatus Endonucleobacter bathymodioli]